MSAPHLPYIKWFPTDWRADPRLRMCSLAARGLWIELIGYMHEGAPYGFLTINDASPSGEDIAALVGRPLAEVRKAMAELASRQVFSMSGGMMFSRRMVRDKAKAEKDKTNGADGGNPLIRRGTVPKDQRVRPYRRSDAPEKTLRIFSKSGGKCHWCETPLIFQPDGSPNGFHVDHLLPICDGGTNDESNLVPACADCNHKRARIEIPTGTPVSVGKKSDVKAQSPEATSREDRIGSAGASNFTQGSKELSAAFWKALGFESALHVPPEFAGVDWRAVGWETAGWTVDLIDSETRRIGPDKPLTYYEKVFATAFAKRQAPLPIVEIREAEKLTVTHGTTKNQSGVVAAARRLAEQFENQSGDGIEGNPNVVLRVSQG